MSAETTVHAPSNRLAMNRLGLWLFLISDAFTFGGMLIARFYLWGNTRPELNQQLGFLVTMILLASSFFANRSETAMEFGDLKSFRKFALLTLGLGALFVVGVIFVEWPLAGSHIPMEKNVYGAIFFLMTGMHAFHVLTGLLLLWLTIRKANKGIYSAEKHWGVEAAVVYWHFVDVVWIFYYPALYLIGNLVK